MSATDVEAAPQEANVPIIRELPAQDDRFQHLARLFTAHFEKSPDFYVRVPGRVNLIGEHIDYCGYGVCPMALEQDILLAVSVEDEDLLRLRNVEDRIYPQFECPRIAEVAVSIGEGAPAWHQYFLCGIRGILDVLLPAGKGGGVGISTASRAGGADIVKGMNVLVSGRIPASAGLSSSSALVSAAALATAHAHEFPITKRQIADLCAKCERYIGTEGGGMDQAIAFLATEGCAKLIEFSPLRSTDVTLPQGAVFVIAHSLAELNKAATADYNCRVVECRLAGQIIAKSFGLAWPEIRKLSDVQRALDVDLSEMISIVERTLHEVPYSKEEVVAKLQTTSDRLDGTSLTANTRHIDAFKLRQRALHVFREAQRVKLFHATCRDRNADNDQVLQSLGRLMDQSHESLRDLYECSHPRLDHLVELSRDLTLGARLTGAGWGGCVVALVRPHNVNDYLDRLKTEFYTGDSYREGVVFVTTPQNGACVYVASSSE